MFWRCSCFSEAALKGTQKRPPKTPQIDPKTTPRRPPEDQKGHSEKVIEFSSKSKPMLDDFRPPNGTPNGTQNRSKNDLGAQGPPKSAQEPPGGPKKIPPGGPSEAHKHTKKLFENTDRKVFRNRFTQEKQTILGSVAGIGGAAPLEIRPLSL